MGYMSDVKSTRLAGAGGAIFGGPARVKGVYIVSSGTGGSVVIRDGGVTGTIVATLDTPAGSRDGLYEITRRRSSLRN
jgi:hypothetical protein